MSIFEKDGCIGYAEILNDIPADINVLLEFDCSFEVTDAEDMIESIEYLLNEPVIDHSWCVPPYGCEITN